MGVVATGPGPQVHGDEAHVLDQLHPRHSLEHEVGHAAVDGAPERPAVTFGAAQRRVEELGQRPLSGALHGLRLEAAAHHHPGVDPQADVGRRRDLEAGADHPPWLERGADGLLQLGRGLELGQLERALEAAGFAAFAEPLGEAAAVVVSAYVGACAGCLVAAAGSSIWDALASTSFSATVQDQVAQAAQQAGIPQPDQGGTATA